MLNTAYMLLVEGMDSKERSAFDLILTTKPEPVQHQIVPRGPALTPDQRQLMGIMGQMGGGG